MKFFRHLLFSCLFFSFFCINAEETKLKSSETFLYKYKKDAVYFKNLIGVSYKKVLEYIDKNNKKISDKELRHLKAKQYYSRYFLKLTLGKPTLENPKNRDDINYLKLTLKYHIQRLINFAFWSEVEKEFIKDTKMDVSTYIDKKKYDKYLNQVVSCYSEIDDALYKIQILRKSPKEVYSNSNLLQKIYDDENWYLKEYHLDFIQSRAFTYKFFPLYNKQTEEMGAFYHGLFQSHLFVELLDEYLIQNIEKYKKPFEEEIWGYIDLFQFSVHNDEEFTEVKKIIDKILSDKDEIAMDGLNRVNALLSKMNSITKIQQMRYLKLTLGELYSLSPQSFEYRKYVKIKTSKEGLKTYVYNFTKKPTPCFKEKDYISENGFVNGFLMEYAMPKILKPYYDKVVKKFIVSNDYTIPPLDISVNKFIIPRQNGKIKFIDFRKEKYKNTFFEYITKWNWEE